jgi:hypothetical protein
VRGGRRRVEAEGAQPRHQPLALGDGEARVRAHPAEAVRPVGERRERAFSAG